MATKNTTTGNKNINSKGRGSGSTAKKSTTSKSARSSTAKRSSSKRTSSGKKTNTAQISNSKEMIVLAALAFCVLLLLANFHLLGALGPVLRTVNMGIFGFMGYIMPVLLFFGICFLISNEGQAYAWLRLAGALLILFAVCGFCQLFVTPDFSASWKLADYYRESGDGIGGGILGGFAFILFMNALGTIGTSVVLAVVAVLGFVLLTGWSFTGFIKEETQRVTETSPDEQKRRQELAAARLQEREAKRERDHEAKMLRSMQKTERLQSQAELSRERVLQAEHHLIQSAGQKKKTNSQKTVKETVRSETPIKPAADASSFQGNIFFGNQLYEDDPLIVEEDKPENAVVTEDIGMPLRRERTVAGEHSPVTWQSVDKPVEINDPYTEETEPPEVHNYGEDIQWQEEENIISVTDAEEDPFLTYEDAYEDVTDESVVTDAASEYKTVVTSSGKVITVELDGVPGAKKVKSEPKAEEPETPTPIKYVEPKEYRFPSYHLLKRGTGKTSKAALDRELRETAVKLQQTLQNFGVGVTVANVSCGPAVTRYELQPEQGVKVSRITSLADDIKLNLAAADIRIEAPVPGKSVIGIEVPNKENSTVFLRDLLESEEFRSHRSRLAFTVGKDIGGQTIIGDISKMPHLLIAGATGSGKSVCINTLIMSLLYKSKPSEVKMIMIDPKVVELSVYNGIPHLMIPVVTDPKKASGALNWAVAEMTSRYNKFAECTVRDMAGYNKRIDELTDVPEEEKPEKMAHIVIIVDELADLMMVAPGEVEDAICRLAQLARAAGIHLVIATQRPSVNVITGLIKANIPSRIAFAVSSGVDSRTIIDMNGAEKLLGKGDMLYYPQGMQKPVRVQGAFVSDTEVSAVVEALTKQGEVIGGSQVPEVLSGGTGADEKTGMAERDELFLQAGRFIIEKDKASIGNLQRMFKIGFNRAARIMDQLAEAGVVGKEEGTKARKILMTSEEFENWVDEYY